MPKTTPAAVHNRRAIGLMVMSAVLPGSAQYVAGNRRLGWLVLRISLTLVAVAVLLGLGLLVLRGPTLGFLLWGPTTVVMRVAVWVVFLGWLALLIDTWRLAQPLNLSQRARLGLTAGCVSLAVLAGLGTNLAASAFVAAGHVSEVFQGGGDAEAKHGRYNVLLLGVDAAADREGLRPDSITVASIDNVTGRTVLFGLPRNLVDVPFPTDSPLHELYPNGFSCDGECMLNGVYTLGMDHESLYPGKDAGLEATKEAVSETLGLEINYYAMVDIGGFQSLVDAMGGIRLDITKRVPIGGGDSEIYGWIEPGVNVHLDGYHALWFARSREGSSDYERMVRQKCVMSAMAKQLDPSTLATRFVDLAQASSDIVRTDVGADKVSELVDLALRGKDLPIETVNFTPPLLIPEDPDFTLIRNTVAERVAASQGLDETAAPSSSSSETGGTDTSPVAPETSASARSSSATSRVSETQPSPEASQEAEEPVCRVS